MKKIATLVGLILFGGCSDERDTTRVCESSETQPCLCGEDSMVIGRQSCNQDGDAWSECRCNDTEAGSSTETENDADGETDSYQDTDVNSDDEDGLDSETDSTELQDTETETGGDRETEVIPDSDTNTDSDADTDTNADSDVNTDSNAGSNSEGDSDVDSDTAVTIDTVTDSDTVPATDTDTETDTRIDSETGSDSDIDAGEVSDGGDDAGLGDGPFACTELNASIICGERPCVDGYCCNNSCDGLCESCDVFNFEGTCVPTPAGDDPDDDCKVVDDPDSCGLSGLCDGNGSCALYGVNDVCNDSDSCSSGDHCDGAGNCVPISKAFDFTPCEVVTTPDREYDICINGNCVSPGCGDSSCNTSGPHFPTPDTGQRSCYDDAAVMICPEAEDDDYFGQDAQYGWDSAYDDAERYSLLMTQLDEPTVYDNVTQLYWQGCPDGLSGASCEIGAAASYTGGIEGVMRCTELVWGGFDDWRLPDEYELSSILNYGAYNPAVNGAVFPGTVSDYFMSSSVDTLDSTLSRVINFESGGLESRDKSAASRVRCVRGDISIKPPERFVRVVSAYNQWIVVDNFTSHMWQGCSSGLDGEACEVVVDTETYTWEDALVYCEASAWGGFSDWRLPNIEELNTTSISARGDINAFPGLTNRYYWTSTSKSDNAAMAWIGSFSTATSNFDTKSAGRIVRCIRGGE